MKKKMMCTKNNDCRADNRRYGIAAWVFRMFALAVMCLVVSGVVSGIRVEAKTMTKADIEKEIKSIEKEIADLEKKRDTAKKEDEKLKNGYTYVWGDLLNTDPFIVNNLGMEYLWIKDSQNMTNILIQAFGYVKKTGNYRTWNNITCAECKAVKISDKYSKQVEEYEKSINKKKTELQDYQKDLKAFIDVSEDEKEYYVTKGDKFTPSYFFYTGKYNKLKWSSSDTSVVKVNKNGVIKAVGYGVATVTAKASISGNETTFTIWVKKPIKSLKVDEVIYINYDEYKDKIFQIPVDTKPKDASLFISLEPEDSKPAVSEAYSESEEGKVAVKVLRTGYDRMKIYDYADKLWANVELVVYKPLKSLSFKKSKYTIDYTYDDSVLISLKKKPAESPEKIWFEYDEKLVEVWSVTEYDAGNMNDTDYYARLLTEESATITVRSSSGLEDTCEISWKNYKEYDEDYEDDEDDEDW
ncbi:MAG: hypothetical protein K6G81_12770 [Lachnospiraceae bacterium]|nr:hypothetical protein [Lachnospiraceae bacterium]